MNTTQLQSMYLDYRNNFLSVAGFASFYGFTITEAKTLIDLGHIIHERLVAERKELSQLLNK